MGVLVFSCVLALLVFNVTPFNLSASWSGEGFGDSLVLTRTKPLASIGDRVAGRGELEGKVSTYIVEEVLRREGSVFYRVRGEGGAELATMRALELNQAVLLSIPLVGFFARSLFHTLGVLTLIGLPLSVLFINYLMYVLKTLVPSLARRSVRKSVREYSLQGDEKEKVTTSVLEEESEREVSTVPPVEKSIERKGYVTVLKPYSLRKTFSQ